MALANRRLPREIHFQREFSINTRRGIFDNVLVYLKLNREQYLHFLQKD